MRKKKSIFRKQKCSIVVMGAMICSLFTGIPATKMQEVSAATDLVNPVISDGVVTWDSIYFGEYVQSDVDGEETDPIRWRVLSVEENEALLISDKVLTVECYNETRTRDIITWEQSTIRSWLNGYGSTSNVAGTSYEENNFIDTAFSESEQEAIITSYVPNAEDSNLTETYDKVFLLSKDEISNEAYGLNVDISTESYSSIGFSYTDYLCENDNEGYGGIWLRGPSDVDDDSMITFYGGDGYEYDCTYVWGYGVCPAIRLNLSDTSVWNYAGKIKSLSFDEITAKKADKFYLLGETISLDDWVVTATYSVLGDTVLKKITNYTTNVADIDMTTVGTKELVISYTDLGVERTAIVKIIVSDKEPTEDEMRDIQVNDYLYEVMDDGTIQIMGYKGSDKNLYIPYSIDGKKVTKIGDNAFAYPYTEITSIDIPEGITTIGSEAFLWCQASFQIPESVKHIGKGAFEGSGITSITIPAGVTSIEDYCFYQCGKLTNITIPEGVTSIGASAFEGCGSLENINLPAEVTSIENRAFCACVSLMTINIPEGITSIEDEAFRGCSSLTNFTIPEGVTSIGSSAFSGCSSLTTVTIPEGVKSIGSSAFYGCSSLADINIPHGVTEIGARAFVDTLWLNTHLSNNDLLIINGILVKASPNVKTVAVPSNVKSIASYAFEGCSSLISIKILDSVTSIGEGVFSDCGDFVIYANKGSAAERYAWDEEENRYWWQVLPIEQYVEVPTTEHQHTFDAGTITQQPTTTTEGVKTYVCIGCGETKTEPIPKLVETPDQPSTPDQPGTPDQPSIPDQPGTPDQPSTPNQPSTPDQPSTDNDLVEVGTSTNVSGVVYKVTKCSNKAKEVEYLEPVSSKKTSVTIPATVKINKETYKVTAVSANAFKNNKKLKSVTIGKNVTKLGKNAFSGCKNLKKITIKSTNLKSVGNNALKGIDKKATIKVPKKQYNKYKKLFKSKTGYKKSMKIKK